MMEFSFSIFDYNTVTASTALDCFSTGIAGSNSARGMKVYECVSKSYRTESITKYMPTTINTR
jgi:hypothetical protein